MVVICSLPGPKKARPARLTQGFFDTPGTLIKVPKAESNITIFHRTGVEVIRTRTGPPQNEFRFHGRQTKKHGGAAIADNRSVLVLASGAVPKSLRSRFLGPASQNKFLPPHHG